jgi:hypothetical protein
MWRKEEKPALAGRQNSELDPNQKRKKEKMKKVLSVILMVLALQACSGAPTPTTAPSTGGFDVNQYVGVYEGTWTNKTTGASGPTVVTIVANESDKTVSITLDFGGNYLGLNDPPAFTLTTKYDDNGASVKGDNKILGQMDITIDKNGNIVAILKNLVGGTIPSMTYTGKIGDGRLDTDYTVTLADGTTTFSELRTVRK